MNKSLRTLLRDLFALPSLWLDHYRGHEMNSVLRQHIRDAQATMWLPLHPNAEQRPYQWGKSGYFFLLGREGWVEVWRCERWQAHMLSLTVWDWDEPWD